MIKEFEFGVSKIGENDFVDKHALLSRQITENLLEMSLNIDDKKIKDLETGETRNKSNRDLKVKFNLTGTVDPPARMKVEESPRSILIKDRMPLSQLKGLNNPPKSSRRLHDIVQNSFSTQIYSTSQYIKQPLSFNFLNDSNIKQFSSGDNFKTDFKDQMVKTTDNYPDYKPSNRSHEPLKSLTQAKNPPNRILHKKGSIDHQDINFSKSGLARIDALKSIKSTRQTSDGISHWSDVFKKACNKKK